MAKVLTENERDVVAAALRAYRDKLTEAAQTGVHEVDSMVAERRDVVDRLAEEAIASRRISFTVAE